MSKHIRMQEVVFSHLLPNVNSHISVYIRKTVTFPSRFFYADSKTETAHSFT